MDESDQLTSISNNISAAPRKFIKNGWFRNDLFGYLQQESMFWKKDLWEQVDGLNLNYKIAADFDLWIKFSEHAELITVDLPIAAFRKREDSRSILQKDSYLHEIDQICRNKKKYPYLLRKFAKFSQKTNFLLRLLTIKKCSVYFYKRSKAKWVLTSKYRSISNDSLSKLLLEI